MFLGFRKMTGSLTLREYPGRYGPDIRLPDLREEIAQCKRHGQMHDACMVHYVDLVPPRKTPPS
jgi:hypothetical protein